MCDLEAVDEDIEAANFNILQSGSMLPKGGKKNG
jgi:hypothetical protein